MTAIERSGRRAAPAGGEPAALWLRQHRYRGGRCAAGGRRQSRRDLWGSGGHLTALIDWSLAQLHPGGRLVMTFILQENLHSALAHLRQSGIQVDCQQLAVSTTATTGSGHY